MKKILALFFVLVICATLCSCSESLALTDTLCTGEWISENCRHDFSGTSNFHQLISLRFFDDGTCEAVWDAYRDGIFLKEITSKPNWEVKKNSIIVSPGSEQITFTYADGILTGNVPYCSNFTFTQISCEEAAALQAEERVEAWVLKSIGHINSNGKQIQSSSYSYNKAGERISKKTSLAGVPNEDSYTYSYFFNDAGRLSEVHMYENGVLHEVLLFNEQGLIVELLGYYPDGRSQDHKLFVYEDHGRLVSVSDYYDSGNLNRILSYSYAENGICKEIVCHEANDVLLYITQCDENGDPSHTQYYNKKAPEYTHEYIYDSNGNLTEIIDYFAGTAREQDHTVYTYGHTTVTKLQKQIMDAKYKAGIN